MLKVGFARTDITPCLGIGIEGYYSKRISDGVLDPLLATAVAFDDGNKLGIVLSVDIIGITQGCSEVIREDIAEAVGTTPDGIFMACTHIHTGPVVNLITNNQSDVKLSSREAIAGSEYASWLKKRLVDLCVMAVSDMAPAKLFATGGEVKDVAFIRRYRMKDGTIRTNPGWQNPDILEPVGEADEMASLLIIKREGKKEIGIVNFQVHPDVISGTKFSADYPKFVRDTYEYNVPDSLCMYLNGAQGDLNHIDVRLNPDVDTCAKGYGRARYMGKKIAMAVLANYELAKEIKGDTVDFAQTLVNVRHNKGSEEEIPAALELVKRYRELGAEKALPEVKGMLNTQQIAKAVRIKLLMDMPEYRDLRVSAFRVGDVLFGGYPGEPFTEMGMKFKQTSNYALTMAGCIVNGYEGYFPTHDAFEQGSYEALSAKYERDTAKKLVDALITLGKQLKQD